MTRPPNLNVLTGIRGWALLLVLLSHSSNAGLYLMPLLNFSGIGGNGVFLFFVLSAFLLTRQFLIADFKHSHKLRLIKHYFKRRVLRIYPLFLLALLVYYGLSRNVLLTPEIIVKSLLLQEGKSFFGRFRQNFSFIFYCLDWLLPYIYIPKTAVLLSSLFCALWNRYYLSSSAIPPNVLGFLAIFVMGSLTAFIVHHVDYIISTLRRVTSFPFMPSRVRWNVGTIRKFLNGLTGGLLLLAQVALCPSFYTYITGKSVGSDYFHNELMLFATLSSLLIMSALYCEGQMRKLLESAFLVFWGEVSFSAYLLHMLVLEIIMYHSPTGLVNPLKWLLFFSITAFISYGSYRCIEQPLTRLGDNRV